MLHLSKLKTVGVIKTYNEHTVIFREGDLGDDIYFVLLGTVEIFINSKDGKPIKVAEIAPGGFFGEMSLLEGEPRSATAIAVKDTITLMVGKPDFDAFIYQQPAMAYKIMKVLSSRIRALNEQLASLGTAAKYVPSVLPKAEAAPKQESKAQPSKVEAPAENADKAILPELSASSLYPPEHKNYPQTAPAAHAANLFSKNVKCPVCVTEFPVELPWMSKLRSMGIDHDFRQHYADMDVLWYNIWVCPHCLYAGYSGEFNDILSINSKSFMEMTKPIKDNLSFQFSKPRKLNEVFTSYYLALYSTKFIESSAFKNAKLWLHLSWLYRDINDEVMYGIAAQNALDCYRKIVFEGDIELTSEQEQQCNLIMGELYLSSDQREEALKCYHAVIEDRKGNPRYVSQARERIYSLKNER